MGCVEGIRTFHSSDACDALHADEALFFASLDFLLHLHSLSGRMASFPGAGPPCTAIDELEHECLHLHVQVAGGGLVSLPRSLLVYLDA